MAAGIASFFIIPIPSHKSFSLRAIPASPRRTAGLLDSSRPNGLGWWRSNRLTVHSPGFFSVYTWCPANQACFAGTLARKINEQLKQTPPSRNLSALGSEKDPLSVRDVMRRRSPASRAVAPHLFFLHATLEHNPSYEAAIPCRSCYYLLRSPPFLDWSITYGQLDALLVPVWMPQSVELHVAPPRLEAWQIAIDPDFS